MQVYDHNRRWLLLRDVLKLTGILLGVAFTGMLLFIGYGICKGPGAIRDDDSEVANLQIIRNAVATYRADMGAYPASLHGLYQYSGPKAKYWRGPDLKKEGDVIGDTAIPVNPYASGSTIASHWIYDPKTGTVCSAVDAMLPNGKHLRNL